MRGRIVLVAFPFDDLSAAKVRPALCITDPVGRHGHVVVAFITSSVQAGGPELASDLVLMPDTQEFAATGLHVASTIRLHRLLTLTLAMMPRQLGQLSPRLHAEAVRRLHELIG